MKNKLMSIFVLGALMFTLVGCGSSDSSELKESGVKSLSYPFVAMGDFEGSGFKADGYHINSKTVEAYDSNNGFVYYYTVVVGDSKRGIDITPALDLEGNHRQVDLADMPEYKK